MSEAKEKMKIRTISGACFVAIVTGFFLLREFVSFWLFDILIWFFCAVGSFEVARAVLPFTEKRALIPSVIFGAIYAPVYMIVERFLWSGYGWLVMLGLTIAVLGVTFEVAGGADNAKKGVIALLPVVYPSLFILTFLMNNHSELGFIALLLVFVISPLSDTFAYLVGMTYGKIKKGNVKKLCPKLSPNKTWAGAIGGVIGGTLGSILVYLIFDPSVRAASPILAFAIIGVIASVLTEIGDLFESFVKRRAGIKDMGKIMPGHGGVMDRIDGMSFASAFIFFAFLII